MTGPQVTSAGFTAQDRGAILDDLFALARLRLGPDADLSTQSDLRLGIVDPMADRELQLQAALSLLVDALQLGSADGVPLDWLGQRLGARARNARSKAAGDVVICGSSAVFISAGYAFRQSATESTAETTEDGTLAALTAWATGTAYVIGDKVKNGGDCFVCYDAGTSAGAGPGPVEPATPTDPIADNTAGWFFVGTGEYAATVAAEATDAGAFSPTAGSFDESVTSLGNVTGARNFDDWTPGTDTETDAEYRLGIAQSLRGRRGTLGAIARAVAALDFVTTFLARTNRTSSVDSAGDAAHSAHVILSNPLTLTDAQKTDVLEALADVWPAGIECVGSDFRGDVVIACTNGVTIRIDNEVGADFADALRVYCKVEITYIASEWPSDGAQQVKDYLDARTFRAGEECRPNTLERELSNNVAGIADITVKLSTTTNPPTTRIRIDATDIQVIGIASADVTVTETVET